MKNFWFILVLAVLHVIQKHNIKNDTSNSDEMTFDGNTVKAKYMETFGIKLDLESKYFPSRKMISQSFITYELGKFYAYPTGFYFNAIDRNYQDVYKVSDDTYYVTFVDNEFNDLEYSFTTDSIISSEELFGDVIANWPNEARFWLKPEVQRYAVVKYVNGAPKVHYIGAQNLTDEQLAAF